MNRSDLLANIHRDRDALDALVSSLSEAQLTAAGDDGGWYVVDHLSHVAAWERMIVAHLRDGTDHEIAGMDAASYATAALDKLNERLHRLTQDRPLAQTRREFGEAHEAVVAFIAAMSEERLDEAYWDDDPWARTVLDKIAGDTYLHYREHAGWIGELVARTAGVP